MEILWGALSSAVVLLLPGLALLPWLQGRSASMQASQDFWTFLADGIGLSAAASACLALAFFLLGVRAGGWGMVVLGVLCLASVFAAGLTKRLPRFKRKDLPALGIGLASLICLAALRIYQVRDLVFPNWVDSVHHTLIVRAFIDAGGIPESLQLTTPAPFHYHYTFHLLAAEMGALAQIPPDQAVMWFGHALFLGSALSVYRLGRASGLDPWASWISAMLTGFVLHMPGYYLSWGRYTLLTGLVVLPVGMAAALELLPRADFADRRLRLQQARTGLKLALLTAGLSLTHYLALLLFAFFLGVLACVCAARAIRWRRVDLLPWLAAGASMVGISAALPWLLPMLQFNTAQAKIDFPVVSLAPGSFTGFVNMLKPEQSLAVMALAGVCALPALLRRGMREISLWGLVIAFFAMPFAPRLGPFRGDHFTIVLFIPAALLLGWGLRSGETGLADLFSLPARRKVTRAEGRGERDAEPGHSRPVAGWAARRAGGVLVLAVTLLLIWGVSKTRNIINNATIIADAADRRALEWIMENTPLEARFYINSVLWQGDIYRGIDGGYWLQPLTGRASLVPPVVYTWQPESVWRQVVDWAKRSGEIKSCTPGFWQIVREAKLSYVYVREGKGNLQPDTLDACPRLEKVYDKEGVAIYRILQP